MLDNWLDLVCRQGKDDVLPYFYDWLQENGHDHELVRSYIVGEFVVEYVKSLNIHPEEVTHALKTGTARPDVAWAIKEIRVEFRRKVANYFQKDIEISTQSFPRWVPRVVARDLSTRLGDATQYFLWSFAEDMKPESETYLCKHHTEMYELGIKEPFRINQDRVLRLTMAKYHYNLHNSEDEPVRYGIQKWAASVCRHCNMVIWGTDGYGLEQYPCFQ